MADALEPRAVPMRCDTLEKVAYLQGSFTCDIDDHENLSFILRHVHDLAVLLN